MGILAASIVGSTILPLVAAPGEPPVAERDVPEVAKFIIIGDWTTMPL